jgi:hypothetical protein
MNIVAFSDLGRGCREFIRRGEKFMANNRKHKVEFRAHHTVREEVPVEFKTRDGHRVSFEAKKKVKEPVRVKFMAKDK